MTEVKVIVAVVSSGPELKPVSVLYDDELVEQAISDGDHYTAAREAVESAYECDAVWVADKDDIGASFTSIFEALGPALKVV